MSRYRTKQHQGKIKEARPLEFRDLGVWPRVGASYRTNPTMPNQGTYEVTSVYGGLVYYGWRGDIVQGGPHHTSTPVWLFAAMALRDEIKPDAAAAEIASLRQQVTELADVLGMILRERSTRGTIPSGLRVAGYGALARIGGRGLGDVLREFEAGMSESEEASYAS